MKLSTHKLAVSLLTVAATAAAAAPFALARDDKSPSSGRHTTRLVLSEVSVEAHGIDNPAPTQFDGTSPNSNKAGDTVTFTSDFHRSTKTGPKVGINEGTCTTIDAADSVQDCNAVVTLGRRSFRMAGAFGSNGGTLAIVGGTGSFVGASGTDRIVNNPDGTATHTVTVITGR
jgi:hypothetical protein